MGYAFVYSNTPISSFPLAPVYYEQKLQGDKNGGSGQRSTYDNMWQIIVQEYTRALETMLADQWLF